MNNVDKARYFIKKAAVHSYLRSMLCNIKLEKMASVNLARRLIKAAQAAQAAQANQINLGNFKQPFSNIENNIEPGTERMSVKNERTKNYTKGRHADMYYKRLSNDSAKAGQGWHSQTELNDMIQNGTPYSKAYANKALNSGLPTLSLPTIDGEEPHYLGPMEQGRLSKSYTKRDVYSPLFDLEHDAFSKSLGNRMSDTDGRYYTEYSDGEYNRNNPDLNYYGNDLNELNRVRANQRQHQQMVDNQFNHAYNTSEDPMSDRGFAQWYGNTPDSDPEKQRLTKTYGADYFKNHQNAWMANR